MINTLKVAFLVAALACSFSAAVCAQDTGTSSDTGMMNQKSSAETSDSEEQKEESASK